MIANFITCNFFRQVTFKSESGCTEYIFFTSKYAQVIVCSFDPSAFCPAQGKSFFIKVVLKFIYEDH